LFTKKNTDFFLGFSRSHLSLFFPFRCCYASLGGALRWVVLCLLRYVNAYNGTAADGCWLMLNADVC
jgi:hypothetical protein